MVKRTCPLYRCDVNYESMCLPCGYYVKESTACRLVGISDEATLKEVRDAIGSGKYISSSKLG